MTTYPYEIGDRIPVPRCRCGCAEPAQPYGTVLDVDPDEQATYYLVDVVTSSGHIEKVFSEGELVRGTVSVIAYHDGDAANTWPVAVTVAGSAA